jgi:hypothetical protein
LRVDARWLAVRLAGDPSFHDRSHAAREFFRLRNQPVRDREQNLLMHVGGRFIKIIALQALAQDKPYAAIKGSDDFIASPGLTRTDSGENISG